MMLPWQEVTADELRRSDAVFLTDVKRGFSRQLSGQNDVPIGVVPGAPRRTVRVLDIEIDSSSSEEIARAENFVKLNVRNYSAS